MAKSLVISEYQNPSSRPLSIHFYKSGFVIQSNKLFTSQTIELPRKAYEPSHEKTNDLHMRKQRRRAVVQ